MAPYYVLAFSLCGSLVAFLIFNFQPAKIFMGDTGSLLIGAVNAILVFKFIDPGDGPESVNPIDFLTGHRIYDSHDSPSGYPSGVCDTDF